MIDFLVQSLAIVRLLHLCIEEDGPYKILEKLRRRIGINKYGVASNELGGLFTCYLCLGIWLTPVIVFLYMNAYWVVWCLAVAQGAAFIYALFERVMYND